MTQQINEEFRFNGEVYEVLCPGDFMTWPSHLTQIPEVVQLLSNSAYPVIKKCEDIYNPEKHGLKPSNIKSTACHRGYISTFAIVDDRLVLAEYNGTTTEIALDFTGTFLIRAGSDPTGKEYGGYLARYRGLVFDHGRVVENRDLTSAASGVCQVEQTRRVDRQVDDLLYRRQKHEKEGSSNQGDDAEMAVLLLLKTYYLPITASIRKLQLKPRSDLRRDISDDGLVALLVAHRSTPSPKQSFEYDDRGEHVDPDVLRFVGFSIELGLDPVAVSDVFEKLLGQDEGLRERRKNLSVALAKQDDAWGRLIRGRPGLDGI